MVELGAFWFKDNVEWGPMLSCSVRTGPHSPWEEYIVGHESLLPPYTEHDMLVIILCDKQGVTDPTFWCWYEVNVISSSINDSKLAFLN